MVSQTLSPLNICAIPIKKYMEPAQVFGREELGAPSRGALETLNDYVFKINLSCMLDTDTMCLKITFC